AVSPEAPLARPPHTGDRETPRRVPVLQPRQRDTALALVLSGLVAVRDLARLVAFEEQHLGDAFVRIDLRRQRRGVADLERHVTLPLGLERRDVRDDAAPRVGGLAG